jgi:hypothetical protein
MAWALIENTWQYTNKPTPNARNEASITHVDSDEEVTVNLKPCAPNQYRNPETNRCRMLVAAGSTLTACKDGQYRSEITNRCRSIASDANTLSPCNRNQERNIATNRCRLVASTDTDLTACKDGQERSIETNRCRNVTTSVPAAGFAVEPIVDAGSSMTGWWALGCILFLALGYAVWEWHQEIVLTFRKLSTFFHLHK